MAAEPNRQRCFVQGKYLPKVFIAYPRKPTVYHTLIPPAGARDNPDAWRQYDDELDRLGRSDDAEVRAHEELVREFAEFLHTQSIAVAYDLIVRDIGALNVMRWYQTQIADSDYIILVVTPSLRPFLDGNFPLDKEPLFKSDYLYNIIHSRPKGPDGSPLDIIPVFLKSARNLDYIPTALEASSMYEVTDDVYRMPLSEGMTSLLCRLTGQNRYEPPPREKQIIIPPKRSRCKHNTTNSTIRTSCISSV